MGTWKTMSGDCPGHAQSRDFGPGLSTLHPNLCSYLVRHFNAHLTICSKTRLRSILANLEPRAGRQAWGREDHRELRKEASPPHPQRLPLTAGRPGAPGSAALNAFAAKTLKVAAWPRFHNTHEHLHWLTRCLSPECLLCVGCACSKGLGWCQAPMRT